MQFLTTSLPTDPRPRAGRGWVGGWAAAGQPGRETNFWWLPSGGWLHRIQKFWLAGGTGRLLVVGWVGFDREPRRGEDRRLDRGPSARLPSNQ